MIILQLPSPQALSFPDSLLNRHATVWPIPVYVFTITGAAPRFIRTALASCISLIRCAWVLVELVNRLNFSTYPAFLCIHHGVNPIALGAGKERQPNYAWRLALSSTPARS
mgnify:CR=1 FL=1